MTDVFREVDEDVRRDEYVRLWRRYGKFGIGLLVVIVLGVSAAVGWREYRRSVLTAEGDRYAAALELRDKGESDKAIAAFDALGREASGGYGVLARLEKAAVIAGTGRTAEAVAAYDEIAKDTSLDAEIRDIAGVFAAMRLFDEDGAKDVESRLKALDREDNAWRHSVREMRGVLAHRNGDHAGAAAIFKALSTDMAAPESLRNRAKELANAMGQQS